MKKIYISLALAALLGVGGCDKGFEDVNTNPVLAPTLDPALLFANAQFTSAFNTLNYPSAIVQQIIVPYTGVHASGNHNIVSDANASPFFNNLYGGPNGNGGPVKNLVDVMAQTKDNPARSNLYNMARIWRAYVFQVLVDTYGDVPYSEAGGAYLQGITLPKYDPQQDIYNDLLKELSESLAALDATKPIETNDLFYSGNIDQWKRLGNSLLLRVAMRLTKVDEAKARQYTAQAFAGGVMQSNADNAFIQFNATFNNPNSGTFQGTERANYYLGQPFVDYLKAANDPRLAVIAVKYETPANPLATAGAEDTNPLNQQGMPFGYNENTLATAPGFPGKIGSAFKYSQINRRTLGKLEAPEFFVTYAQTQLLLAEAAQRGYITGDASLFYANGVRGHMKQLAQYDPLATIPDAAIDAYLLANPFDPARALEQINTQYWVASFLNGSEAWANFRRSGYPALTPNPFPAADPAVLGSFIRRLVYPFREASVNAANYQAAVARMGADDLATRVFWDK